MSRVAQIESEVRTLTPDELRVFRDWFLRFHADAWDAQIEADVKSGKLKSLAEAPFAITSPAGRRLCDSSRDA